MAIAISGARGKLAGVPGGAYEIKGLVDLPGPGQKPLDVPGARTQARVVEEPSRETALFGLGFAVTPIETEVSPATSVVGICQVLAAWRAAERELAGLTEDSPEWGRVQTMIVDHRTAYLRLFDERMGWGDVDRARPDVGRLPGG